MDCHEILYIDVPLGWIVLTLLVVVLLLSALQHTLLYYVLYISHTVCEYSPSALIQAMLHPQTEYVLWMSCKMSSEIWRKSSFCWIPSSEWDTHCKWGSKWSCNISFSKVRVASTQLWENSRKEYFLMQRAAELFPYKDLCLSGS